MAIIDSLRAYWKFDESSGNAADAHTGGHTLTNNGTIPYVAAKLNNGADLEATDAADFFEKADHADFDITTNLSISCWINIESAIGAGGYRILADKFEDTGSQKSYALFLTNNGGTLQVIFTKTTDGATRTDMVVNWAFSTATWYHLVSVYDDTAKTTEFFVDGSSIGTSSAVAASGIYSGTATFRVGNGHADFFGSGWWDGIIDEYGIWAKKLTSAEVTSLYNGGTPMAYPFTEATSGKNFLMFMPA